MVCDLVWLKLYGCFGRPTDHHTTPAIAISQHSFIKVPRVLGLKLMLFHHRVHYITKEFLNGHALILFVSTFCETISFRTASCWWIKSWTQVLLGLFEGLRCKSRFTAISQALWAICFRFREAWSFSRVRMIETSNSSSSGFRYGIPRTLVAWGFRIYLFTLFTLRLLAWQSRSVQTPICEESALYLHQLKEHEMLVVFDASNLVDLLFDV